jgi:LysR family hca operon transcriptional activator
MRRSATSTPGIRPHFEASEAFAARFLAVADELPNTQVVIFSLSSPGSRRRVDTRQDRLAFLRHERNAPGIVFTHLTDEPLSVLMPADHRQRRATPLPPRNARAVGRVKAPPPP